MVSQWASERVSLMALTNPQNNQTKHDHQCHRCFKWNIDDYEILNWINQLIIIIFSCRFMFVYLFYRVFCVDWLEIACFWIFFFNIQILTQTFSAAADDNSTWNVSEKSNEEEEKNDLLWCERNHFFEQQPSKNKKFPRKIRTENILFFFASLEMFSGNFLFVCVCVWFLSCTTLHMCVLELIRNKTKKREGE